MRSQTVRSFVSGAMAVWVVFVATAAQADVLVNNTLNAGREGWRVYDYNGKPYPQTGGKDVWFDAKWHKSGGVGDSGYISGDDSMWRIDVPEDPMSILALIIYQNWPEVGGRALDLRNKTVSLYLRGDNLDLKGAKAYFWALSYRKGLGGTRWHFMSKPLHVSKGSWGQKVTFQLTNDERLWHRTYSYTPSNPASLDYVLEHADSYGISFLGFSGEPTGTLAMDEFTITTDPVPEPDAAAKVLVNNAFSAGREGWRVYDYNGKPYPQTGGENVYFNAKWHKSGGVGDSGYISGDDSMWRIDVPEDPMSILALMIYQNWPEVGGRPLDLRNKTVSLYLRGDNLDLKGAKAYFWVLSNRRPAGGTRWHFTAKPLPVSKDRWGEKITFQLTNDESLWHRTWSYTPSNPTSLDRVLEHVDSFGISFLGFSGEPTGTVSMDEFLISTDPIREPTTPAVSAVPPHHPESARRKRAMRSDATEAVAQPASGGKD